ncbi:UNVERIFIED_CONTAM: protein NPG1 [Sesamum calycinum]|uniref:Protein NPG1 n=1 Tax=Sesamum calycinum TaxID=2727403 RepID=A0AAW2QZI9_9LAMI
MVAGRILNIRGIHLLGLKSRKEATVALEGDLSYHTLRANSVVQRSELNGCFELWVIFPGPANWGMSAKNETLSVYFQEARALLGKLEYQRGNLEGALRVFDGIDLQATIQRVQHPLEDRPPSKKGRTRSETSFAVSQHSTNLVLEAIYLKAKSLQKLGKLTEAAQECKSVLDAVEKIFVDGIPDVLVDNKLQETISHAVELLPELWKKAGCYSEAMSAYRRALLSQWNIDNECCARIQKAFAVFLLYSGVDFCAPSLSVQIDGSYIPRNNLEEAILLLMILIRKAHLGKIKWDPSVIDHLTSAISLCGQTSVLAKQLEEVMPGVIHRTDRWKTMALSFSGSGQKRSALDLLKKSLNQHEAPNDVESLLLAAKICSEDVLLAADGVKYAQRAIANANDSNAHLKGVGLRMLGLCLGKQAKVSSSDFERSCLQSEALKSLDSAVALEFHNPDLIFELGILYAEHRNLDAALRCAKQYLDRTGGSMIRGWRLLALVLSAQQRFSEAEVVTDAALDETSKWDQGPLLRMKAKLKISQSLHMDAVETYRYLLALVQAQKKSYGPLGSSPQEEHEKVDEYEVWHGLASLYASLSRWKDAEICLGKARALKHYSAETLHTEVRRCGLRYLVTGIPMEGTLRKRLESSELFSWKWYCRSIREASGMDVKELAELNLRELVGLDFWELLSPNTMLALEGREAAGMDVKE